MANFVSGGTVWAGFLYSGGSSCVASATVSWNSSLTVTISNVKYSYASGSSLSATCKWRVKNNTTGSIVAGYTDTDFLGSSFKATSGTKYTFQACAAGAGYAWGNSTVEEGKEGSSYFTVTSGSGGGGGSDVINYYIITYDANGGTGAPSPTLKIGNYVAYISEETPTKDSVNAGSYTVIFDAGSGLCGTDTLKSNIIKTYEFGYWNTEPDGSGVTYTAGKSYSGNANLYLYAIYLESVKTESIELPMASKDGYSFLGWSTNQNADSGILGSFTPSSNITLYAIWKADGLLHIFDGNNFVTFQIFIYDGSSWGIYCPNIFDFKWYLCS